MTDELHQSFDLLALCLRRQADFTQIADWTDVEWEQVWQQAANQGLFSLLYQNLVRDCPKIILAPARVRFLRDHYYFTTARNLTALHQLKLILAGLQQAGIEVILLKGAYLAEHVYGNPGIRPMSDFDLLVPQPELMKAVGVLEQMGYSLDRQFLPELEFPAHKHAPPLHKAGEFPVEIHWTIMDLKRGRMQIPEGQLWQRSVAVFPGTPHIRSLSPEDLVLHLCIHLAYGHRFLKGLRQLVDITKVCEKYEGALDWAAVEERARQWQAVRGVYLALYLAHDVLGAPVPAETLLALHPEEFSPGVVEWALDRLYQRLPALSENFNRMLVNQDFRGKLRWLLHGLLPPFQVMWQMYGTRGNTIQTLLLYPPHIVERIKNYWQPLRLARGEDTQMRRAINSEVSLSCWLKIDAW